MDPSNLPLVFSLAILLVFSAYFSCAEAAYSQVNKIKLKSLADNGNKKAKTAINIVENFDKTLTTILVGNNIVNAACSAVATVLAINIFNSVNSNLTDKVISAIVTLITTAVICLVAEMLPKTFAATKSDWVAVVFAPSMKFLNILLFPISVVFSGVAKLMSKIFKVKEEPTVTEEELSDIIDSVEEDGFIDEDRSELLQSALEFSRRTVANVVTLRDDIDAIDIRMSNEQILEHIKKSKYSHLPVYSGDLDHIIGTLFVRRFLAAYIKNKNVKVRNLLTKPYFVTLEMSIDELLEDMRLKRNHMALAKDKNGHIFGLVTIEDFLEELVGEIWDEADVVNNDFIKLGGNCFDISAALDISRVFDLMKYTPERRVAQRKTVQTWVLENLGRAAEEEDTFEYEHLTVTVTEAEDSRVQRINIRIDTPELDEAIEEAELAFEQEREVQADND